MKYDLDNFVTRTMWWRTGTSVTLGLIALTLIFIGNTASEHNEATQRRLDALQQQLNAVQSKMSCDRVNTTK